MNKQVIINARKFDGALYRSWSGDLVEKDKNLLVFFGVFENEVKHTDLGIIRPGTISYEFYWLDRWYNIFRFHEPDGAFRNFYCNINLPPQFADGVLDYIDLDIDVLISKEFSIKVLDTDEYEQNSQKFQYPQAIKEGVQRALSELLDLAESRQFPFDFPNSEL
jgi:protein associated with RNAse G/E